MYVQSAFSFPNKHDSSPYSPSPEVIKLCLCSTQLSMDFFLLINVKMPTIVGILTFISRKNSIIGLSEPEKKPLNFLLFLYINEHLKFHLI